jgi:hypothetical protein
MLLNISSRIIINLLLNDIDEFFINTYKNPKIAYSPFMSLERDFNEYDKVLSMILNCSHKSFKITLLTKNFNSDDFIQLNNYIRANTNSSEIILSTLFKDRFKISITPEIESSKEKNNDENMKRIDLSVIDENCELFLSIIIPYKFLRLFSKKIKPEADHEVIESEIRQFFKNPVNIFPNLKMILDTFSDIELQNLLNQLQKSNLLTLYQICLVVLSIPEYSLRLKKNLSTNTVHDVIRMMKRIKQSRAITKRDLIEGIYSIEEAIFFLMRGGVDFSYSSFLSETQKTLERISNIESLLLKDFYQWIEEIEENGLLYKTLSRTRELTIARSISADYVKSETILKKHISERRLKAIRTLLKNDTVSFMDRIVAQSDLIANYRKLKLKRLNLGDESFEYLLRRFTRPYDYSNLLFSVGWFVLSTALKGTKMKKHDKLLQAIPRPASYLIEDVLRGVINPNIIHDEIQIKRARSICVKAIISLYEEGLIHLSD